MAMPGVVIVRNTILARHQILHRQYHLSGRIALGMRRPKSIYRNSIAGHRGEAGDEHAPRPGRRPSDPRPGPIDVDAGQYPRTPSIHIGEVTRGYHGTVLPHF